MSSVANRGVGWLPDVPSMKDYTKDNPKVEGMLKKTALGSGAKAGRTQGVWPQGSGSGSPGGRLV